MSTRLDATQAAIAATKAADILITALAKTTEIDAKGPLSNGLAAASERLPTGRVISALGHPLAAGPAQRVLLDVLGKRTGQTFRNTCHFLDWAVASGFDLPPTAPGAPGAP